MDTRKIDINRNNVSSKFYLHHRSLIKWNLFAKSLIKLFWGVCLQYTKYQGVRSKELVYNTLITINDTIWNFFPTFHLVLLFVKWINFIKQMARNSFIYFDIESDTGCFAFWVNLNRKQPCSAWNLAGKNAGTAFWNPFHVGIVFYIIEYSRIQNYQRTHFGLIIFDVPDKKVVFVQTNYKKQEWVSTDNYKIFPTNFSLVVESLHIGNVDFRYITTNQDGTCTAYCLSGVNIVGKWCFNF